MTERQGVRPEQRHTRANPCPICGGYDEKPRGAGVRCHGFTSDDGGWAHCSRKEKAVGAPFNEKTNAYVHKLTGDCKCGVRHDPTPPATLSPNGSEPKARPIPETPGEAGSATDYVYRDPDGRPLYRVKRTADKRFIQQRYDADTGRYVNGLNGAPPVLYNLPALTDPERADEPAFAVEGEKDADNLAAVGLLATTAPMGAGKFRPEHAKALEGRTVYVIPDNDPAGEKHAEQVKAMTGGTIVRLPGLPDGGDVSDWLDAGGTRERLRELARASRDKERPGPISAADLVARDFAPVEYVIADVLPVGVTLLAGKPKKGKSWMSLDMCLAVAAGGKVFGCRSVWRGGSLYLALEDNRRRLKTRLQKVLDGRPAPANMHLHTVWPRLDEGGLELLDEYLDENPDTRLVVIDTLAKIRKPASGKNIYGEDYAALERLLPLAAAHEAAIVVVHHLRKGEAADAQDEISGSTGLAGGVDGYMILRRKPGSKGPTLYVEGRDIEDPKEYALYWNLNTATWTIEGEAEQVHVSKERADILLVLNRAGEPLSPAEVTDRIGPSAKRNSIKYLMWKMADDGQLLNHGNGKYEPAEPTNRTNHTNRDNRTNRTNQHESDAVSGRLVEDSEGTNRAFAHTYAENGESVSAVSGVSEVPLSHDLQPGESATLAELGERREKRQREGEQPAG